MVLLFFWGISGTCAQYLFEQKGLDPGWLVCWRMLLAGLILVLFSMSEKNSDTFRIWKKTLGRSQTPPVQYIGNGGCPVYLFLQHFAL
ncbi:EamA family transporter [Algoriphagus boritolerans]|uniref:EamA family transporter n=1 Tax=Algoriphagus boritolerans TaxID=308111 RepID=UPI003A0FCE12